MFSIFSTRISSNIVTLLRLRHRQPFVALGPPSSWPDRRSGKKNEKNAKLPLFLWKKRCFNGSFGISGSFSRSIYPRFKGGEDLWLSWVVERKMIWGRWFLNGFMADPTLPLVHTCKISNKSDKWDPDLLTLKRMFCWLLLNFPSVLFWKKLRWSSFDHIEPQCGAWRCICFEPRRCPCRSTSHDHARMHPGGHWFFDDVQVLTLMWTHGIPR